MHLTPPFPLLVQPSLGLKTYVCRRPTGGVPEQGEPRHGAHQHPPGGSFLPEGRHLPADDRRRARRTPRQLCLSPGWWLLTFLHIYVQSGGHTNRGQKCLIYTPFHPWPASRAEPSNGQHSIFYSVVKQLCFRQRSPTVGSKHPGGSFLPRLIVWLLVPKFRAGRLVSRSTAYARKGFVRRYRFRRRRCFSRILEKTRE